MFLVILNTEIEGGNISQQDPITRKWRRDGSPVLAADAQTSNLQLPDNMETQVAVNKNHSDMVKYDSQTEETYKDVRFRLAQLVKDAPQTVKDRLAKHDGANMHVRR